MPTENKKKWFFLLTLGSIASLLFALKTGSVSISWAQLAAALGSPDGPNSQIIWELRLPRALAAWLVGAMLALAGCLMQVLLRNPLADPYVLGVSGGAAFAALGALSLGLAATYLPVAAFVGAGVATLLVFGLAHGKGPWGSTRLLLTGVVTAAGWGALISLLLALSADNSLRGMLFWLMGDLSYARISIWPALALGLVTTLCLALARSLNVLALGHDQASLLGENSQRLVWMIYFLASLLTATAVSVAGGIGFVGLIIPHMMRLALSADHRVLIPASVLFGGAFLVFADTLSRTVLAPQQLPVGVITAILGVPMFLFLLNRARLSA